MRTLPISLNLSIKSNVRQFAVKKPSIYIFKQKETKASYK